MGPSDKAGKKVRPPTIRMTPIKRPTNNPPWVGKVPAEAARSSWRQRTGRRHHRHDEQEAADQHREAQGGIVEDRIGGHARKSAAIVAGGGGEGVQDFEKPCGPAVQGPASPALEPRPAR